MMEQPSFKIGLDVIFFMLSVIVVVGILFFPGRSNYYDLVVFTSGGFYLLYTGTRNFRRKESNRQQAAHWYTEPRILVGVALSLGIPWKLLKMDAANIIFIANTIIVLALLLYLAAGYFFFRKFWERFR